MERIVEFNPAYDKRDPDPNKNYGIHGVDMRMVLKGDKGAVQFVVSTNWHLPSVQDEFDARHNDHMLCHPMPADLGYHSFTPMYEGHEPVSDSCVYLNGKPCYYDGSGLNAERVYQILVASGGEAVWKELETYYNQTFGGNECQTNR